MSTPNYGEAVKKFTDAGIHPKWMLPIAPVGAQISKTGSLNENVLGKAPGRFIPEKGVWSGLRGRTIVDGVSREEFQEFSQWPTGNVGVLGRAYPGIDSDAETPEAKRLVENALNTAFGSDALYAERERGTGTRRLYAFRCVDPNAGPYWVRTRHITYTLADGSAHKLDVIGYGGQYLIAGIHPSGDEYGWHSEWSLENYADKLTEIDNADMERFISVFNGLVEKAGGTIERASGGGGSGEEYNITELEPVMAPKAVFDGLAELPNTPETFLHRDDFVSALAAIRAALGKESCQRDVENGVYEWATQDPEWCDDDYFDKIWKSLVNVRVPRDSLDRLFRRSGVRSHVKYAFDDKAPALRDEIKKGKTKNSDKRLDLLARIADRYLFGYVNTREQQASITMRDRWDVEREWYGLPWFKFEMPESDRALLAEIHEHDVYPVNKIGFANFLRDLRSHHPEIWYSGETRHPAYDKGDIVEEKQPDDNTLRKVNMRFLSPAIRAARKPDPDPVRSQQDVAHILKFVGDLFGPMAKYELDTLAYMAQTGDRPGSLLFLVGDQGVGKSIWLNMQMALFDGIGPNQGIIDGAKLMNESARRFMLAKVEGCRILSIRELPEGSNAREMAQITAQLKQIVDPGPEGDWITIEGKGENSRPARNHARVLISSNYHNALHIEQQDRRIFYVQCQITVDNKPDEDYYAHLVNIAADPARLAALWRYLKTRDVKNYTRYTEPPISTEKAERIVAEIVNPAERHLRAAVEYLRVAGRTMFTAIEIGEFMTRMARNEHLNSGGAMDDRKDYCPNDDNKSTVELMNALRTMRKSVAIKLERALRTATKRVPTIYVMSNQGSLAVELMTMEKGEVLYMLDQEQSRINYPEHPWALYRDPDTKKAGE